MEMKMTFKELISRGPVEHFANAVFNRLPEKWQESIAPNYMQKRESNNCRPKEP